MPKLVMLSWRRKDMVERDDSKERAQQDAAVLPSLPVLDKILRYETKLERQMYRALAQLERMQRLRRCQWRFPAGENEEGVLPNEPIFSLVVPALWRAGLSVLTPDAERGRVSRARLASPAIHHSRCRRARESYSGAQVFAASGGLRYSPVVWLASPENAMNNVQTSVLLLGVLVALVLIGRNLRRHLPDHHLSADSRDAVKLAMGLVATMTALLLGLLVSSAKGTYDTQRNEIITMAAKVTFLDRILAAYGPEAARVRAQFRTTASQAIERMWPDEVGVRGELKPDASATEAFYSSLQQLVPQNETQRALKAQASTLAVELGQLRMLLLAQMVPSIPKPLLVVVMAWLGIIFLSFSLLAPPNATTTLSLMAAAISVAGAVFLILELDQPLGGMIRLSSHPMRNALTVLSP